MKSERNGKTFLRSYHRDGENKMCGDTSQTPDILNIQQKSCQVRKHPENWKRQIKNQSPDRYDWHGTGSFVSIFDVKSSELVVIHRESRRNKWGIAKEVFYACASSHLGATLPRLISSMSKTRSTWVEGELRMRSNRSTVHGIMRSNG